MDSGDFIQKSIKIPCQLILILVIILFNLFSDNLGSQIAASVKAQIAPLKNLGSQIANAVEKELEPVTALSLVQSMKRGSGGTTIATHLPSGKF